MVGYVENRLDSIKIDTDNLLKFPYGAFYLMSGNESWSPASGNFGNKRRLNRYYHNPSENDLTVTLGYNNQTFILDVILITNGVSVDDGGNVNDLRLFASGVTSVTFTLPSKSSIGISVYKVGN